MEYGISTKLHTLSLYGKIAYNMPSSRKEEQPVENSRLHVSHVFLPPEIRQQYQGMLQRILLSHHRDLLVLIGRKTGHSGRVITHSIVCENPFLLEDYNFSDVHAATSYCLGQVGKTNPHLDVIGVGAVVGMAKTAEDLLRYGYDLVLAGGDHLYIGKGVTGPLDKFTVYTLDSRSHVAPIPASNVHILG